MVARGQIKLLATGAFFLMCTGLVMLFWIPCLQLKRRPIFTPLLCVCLFLPPTARSHFLRISWSFTIVSVQEAYAASAVPTPTMFLRSELSKYTKTSFLNLKQWKMSDSVLNSSMLIRCLDQGLHRWQQVPSLLNQSRPYTNKQSTCIWNSAACQFIGECNLRTDTALPPTKPQQW